MVSAWTKVAKPTDGGTSLSYTGGEPIGLLLALTQSIFTPATVSSWNKVTKPTTSGFTKVLKPTS